MTDARLPDGDNYVAWRIALRSPDEFAALAPHDQCGYLCALGHLAANTHNTQPWRFRIHGSSRTIEVCLDRGQVLPASDAKGRQAAISVGCAIENIVVGGAHGGADVDVDVTVGASAEVRAMDAAPEACRHVPLATLRLRERVAAAEPHPDASLGPHIPTRRVVRAEYDPRQPIPTEVLDALRERSPVPPTRLIALSDSSVRRRAVAEIQAQADSFVVNSPTFRRELGDWLLPNDTTSYVGMPGVGFGLDDGEAERIHRGLLGHEPLYPDDGLKFSLGSKRGIQSSPLLVFLTTSDDDPRGWIAAGRTLQRALLELERSGFQAAIHAGIVEVPMLNRMFAATLKTTEPLVALFRAGRLSGSAQAYRPHSPRLPLDQVILPE